MFKKTPKIYRVKRSTVYPRSYFVNDYEVLAFSDEDAICRVYNHNAPVSGGPNVEWFIKESDEIISRKLNEVVHTGYRVIPRF
jgi:hypothetical protein